MGTKKDLRKAYQTAWLAEGLLVAAGQLPIASTTRGEVELRVDRAGGNVEALWLPLPPAAQTTGESRDHGVLLLRLGEQRGIRSLSVIEPSRFLLVGRNGKTDPATDLRTLLRNQLAGLDGAVRREVARFIVDGSCNGEPPDRALAENLHHVSEALRERLPVSVIDKGSELCLRADALLKVDDRSFYIEGWSRSKHPLAELIVLAPEGWAVDLAARAYRYPRPDVAEFFGAVDAPGSKIRYGFIAYFELPGPSILHDGWVLLARDSFGQGVEVALPEVTTDGRTVRETIVGDVVLERLPEETLRREHLLPAVQRLQARLEEGTRIEWVDQFGDPPVEPAVSIVVPLYKRIDFVEQQLAQFVLDPEFLETDLIYVLDSPEDADYLRAFAAQLHRLYRIPFRLVTLNQNGGFSLANNLGATLAEGRLLLLLNSDILPSEPGWLGRLAAFHDETPGAGAVSPMLLYEDDTLQFAGLYFDRAEGAHVWSNEHFYKGLHKDLPAANVARPVPAVTAACMLMPTALYRELGGLRGIYVQGDYEDSDLCLRLTEAGYDVWYCPDVALYHLEGQSYPSETRRNTSEFNRWLHTHLWGARLSLPGADAVSHDSDSV